jgi:3-hydroxybutyryl-CoA dehydratase
MTAAFAQRWFEDLRVGECHRTGGRTITEADVVGFAGVSGDFNPQHVDADWAASSIWGERIAHGALILSCALGSLAMQPERVLAVRGIDGVVFKRAVLLGDTIRTRATIRHLRDLGSDYGMVDVGVQTFEQRGHLAMRARVELLWRKRGAER